jgi:hypothetical protein
MTYKGLAHRAAFMSASQRAGLAAQLVLQETSSEKPTHSIAAMATGASSSDLGKALKATPAERAALVAGALTVAELKSNHEELTLDIGVPATEPRVTMKQLLAIYRALTPAQQIAFGRAIGVERVWLPAGDK